MNPFKWFDNDDDWRYRRAPYGWGGPHWGPYGYPGYQPQRTVIIVQPENNTQTAAVYPE